MLLSLSTKSTQYKTLHQTPRLDILPLVSAPATSPNIKYLDHLLCVNLIACLAVVLSPRMPLTQWSMALPDLPMSLFILVSHTTYILENVEGDDPCILYLSIIGRAAVGCFGQGWVNLNIGDRKLSPCKLKCKNSRVTQSSNNKRHPINTPTMVSQSHSTLSYITHVAGSQSKINGAAGLLRRLT